MAGGKETPRQKMIGMMYLVLLALLALQMGQSILTKFQQLDESLSIAVNEAKAKNVGIKANIEASVKEGGGKQQNVLDMSAELRDKSSAMSSFIDDIKDGLVELTEAKDPETGLLLNSAMKDTDKTGAYMVGEGDKTDGKAYALKSKLDAFVNYANEMEKKISKIDLEKPSVHPMLALDAKDDPMFKNDPDKKTYDFAHVNFDHTEMIATMAYLSERQARVVNLEADLQNRLAALVGVADFKFDNVFAMAKPKSSTVAAGTVYESELFVSASSQAIKPKMSSSVGGVRMDGGVGHIKFKATGGKYDKYGNLEKSWVGNITIKKPVGSGDTTLRVTTKYTVSKPVIQVQADAVSALYRNCANPLRILVPALGAEYDPAFTTSGGSGRKGKNKGDYVVYPGAGKKVAITVKSGGATIGTESFKVRSVPKPDIVATVNGKPINEKQGVAAPGPRSITIKAVAESGFKAALPKEARYKITKWSATLVRGRRPAAAPKKFSSGKGDLSSMRSSARAGDRILIEVNDVVRVNSKNQSEKVPVGIVIKNLPLN